MFVGFSLRLEISYSSPVYFAHGLNSVQTRTPNKKVG